MRAAGVPRKAWRKIGKTHTCMNWKGVNTHTHTHTTHLEQTALGSIAASPQYKRHARVPWFLGTALFVIHSPLGCLGANSKKFIGSMCLYRVGILCCSTICAQCAAWTHWVFLEWWACLVIIFADCLEKLPCGVVMSWMSWMSWSGLRIVAAQRVRVRNLPTKPGGNKHFIHSTRQLVVMAIWYAPPTSHT